VKSKLRRFYESIIEGLLLISGSVTSIAVLLIVFFLFKEGIGLFKANSVEQDFVLSVNKANPVESLNAVQLKEIFDLEKTRWSHYGWNNDSIIVFRIDDIAKYYTEEQLGPDFKYMPERINHLVDSLKNIIAYIPAKYVDKDFAGKAIRVNNISYAQFFLGREWFPTARPAAVFGALPLILGTILVSIVAILIALPLGLGVAIYMAEIADERVRRTLKPLIELLSAIPSVVYGFFGLIVIVPLIQKIFNLPVGETGLAGSVVLAIMALPTIITVSEDALRTTPRAMKEASLALGASKWQTIYRVTVPCSISGITAAAILGIGRAVGETMAVLMVTGNAGVMPDTLLAPLRTIPATIAAELGEVSQSGTHYKALFTLGCILFVITLIINISVEFISSRNKFARK
jgi:phosphate transport system permease protein